jgi:thiol-disulfide isomerase/thioredoxin
MKSPITSLLRAAGFAVVLQSTSFGADKSDHKISDWKIGKTLFGEKVTKSDFAGKVVVIENWGVHCPPCVASLPHLAKLEKDHRDKGFLIIGAESQGSSKEQIKPLIEKAGVEYTITEGADGPIEVTGIPRAFVFDREGKLVFDGHPGGSDFEKAVKTALKDKAPVSAPAAPAGPLVASRTWKNTEGKEIVAAVKDATETSVNFLMSGGKKVAYPMEKLDEESQDVIRKALAAAKPEE